MYKRQLVLSSEGVSRTVFGSICRLASEFGSIQKASANTLYYFDEHYETIIRENALQILSLIHICIDVLLKVARYFKETYHKPIRINTNGLGNLVNGRDIAPDFKGLIDTISISLNTPNADRYHELVRSRFGRCV